MPPPGLPGIPEQDDIEKQESLIQLIREAWDHGLNDNTTFWFLMNQIKRLLDEHAEAGADEQHTLEEQLEDSYWQEKPIEDPLVRVDSKDIALDDSLTMCSEATESSDTSSMAYTTRSITSLKDKTNWLFLSARRPGDGKEIISCYSTCRTVE